MFSAVAVVILAELTGGMGQGLEQFRQRQSSFCRPIGEPGGSANALLCHLHPFHEARAHLRLGWTGLEYAPGDYPEPSPKGYLGRYMAYVRSGNHRYLRARADRDIGHASGHSGRIGDVLEQHSIPIHGAIWTAARAGNEGCCKDSKSWAESSSYCGSGGARGSRSRFGKDRTH